jgi:hypothetical protein
MPASPGPVTKSLVSAQRLPLVDLTVNVVHALFVLPALCFALAEKVAPDPNEYAGPFWIKKRTAGA